MNEPYLSTKELIYSEGGFLRIVRGITHSNYDITAVAGWSEKTAKMDALSVVSVTPTYASGAPSTDKYYDTKLSTGVTLRVQNNANAVLAKTGYKTSVDNKAVEKIDATILVSSADYLALLEDYRGGKVIIVIRGMGLKVEDNSIAGYEHMLGIITDLKPAPKDGLFELGLTITAQACTVNVSATGCTYANYNAMACGSSNKIEPVGMEISGGYTIKDLTSGDFNELMTSGKIIQTDPS